MPNSQSPLPSQLTLEEGIGRGVAQRISSIHATCFETAWSAASIEDLLARSGTWVLLAKNSDEDIGYILISQVLDQAEILSFGVYPEFRRTGVASFLLGQSILRLEKTVAEALFLDVSRSSHPARALYEKFGFKKIGVRKNYYRNRTGETDDALQYQLLIE